MPSALASFEHVPAVDVLLGCPDVVYAVDQQARIAFVNWPAWDRFAAENGGEDLLAHDRILGRPIVDFVDGNDTSQSVDRLVSSILAGDVQYHSYPFRCDAPGIARHFRMNVVRIESARGFTGVLFHSVLLEEQPVVMHDGPPERPDAAILTMCSYCRRVRVSLDTPEWIPADEYLMREGQGHPRISHGICPPCLHALALPGLES